MHSKNYKYLKGCVYTCDFHADIWMIHETQADETEM